VRAACRGLWAPSPPPPKEVSRSELMLEARCLPFAIMPAMLDKLTKAEPEDVDDGAATDGARVEGKADGCSCSAGGVDDIGPIGWLSGPLEKPPLSPLFETLAPTRGKGSGLSPSQVLPHWPKSPVTAFRCHWPWEKSQSGLKCGAT